VDQGFLKKREKSGSTQKRFRQAAPRLKNGVSTGGVETLKKYSYETRMLAGEKKLNFAGDGGGPERITDRFTKRIVTLS